MLLRLGAHCRHSLLPKYEDCDPVATISESYSMRSPSPRSTVRLAGSRSTASPSSTRVFFCFRRMPRAVPQPVPVRVILSPLDRGAAETNGSYVYPRALPPRALAGEPWQRVTLRTRRRE